jgi:RimJ/RimL family protein N-acetyltransferase
MTEVLLRPLSPLDVERIHRWHNDISLYRYLGASYRPVERSKVDVWIAQRMAAGPREVNCAICVRRSARHVGNIYLRDIDSLSGTAELHVFIGNRRDRGRGIGSKAISALCQHGIHELGLREIVVRVLVENLLARQVYKKCGFRDKELLPAAIRKGGRDLDAMLMTFDGVG